MKKVILPGLLVGVILLVVGMGLSYLLHAIFPSITTEYANTNIFRPWDDPLMSLYFAYPFLLGIVFAWAWNKTKSLFKGSLWKRGAQFGLALWLIASIPGMLITYSSFQVSLLLVFSWLLTGLVNGIVAGWVFAKLNK